ncbi:hypothetical protein PG997_010150 [Apiospora hydei]|uniref:Uncharacterized protein n=1 Tax=Apiospora hydei TaxID=1337664 RepID=A0ABR1VXC2_9PEZI
MKRLRTRQRVGGGVGVVAVHIVLQRDLGREPVAVDELLHDALLRVPVLVDEDDLAPVPVAVVAAVPRGAPLLDRVGARVAVGRVRVVGHGQLDALGAQGQAGAVDAESVDHALLQDARSRVVDGRVQDLLEAGRDLGLVARDDGAHLAGDVGPGDELVVDPLRQGAGPRRDGPGEGHEADDGGHGLVEVLHGRDVVRGRDAEVRDDARQGQADDARAEGDGRVERVHVAVPVLDRDQAVPRRQLDGQARLARVAEVVEAAADYGGVALPEEVGRTERLRQSLDVVGLGRGDVGLGPSRKELVEVELRPGVGGQGLGRARGRAGGGQRRRPVISSTEDGGGGGRRRCRCRHLGDYGSRRDMVQGGHCREEGRGAHTGLMWYV